MLYWDKFKKAVESKNLKDLDVLLKSFSDITSIMPYDVYVKLLKNKDEAVLDYMVSNNILPSFSVVDAARFNNFKLVNRFANLAGATHKDTLYYAVLNRNIKMMKFLVSLGLKSIKAKRLANIIGDEKIINALK